MDKGPNNIPLILDGFPMEKWVKGLPEDKKEAFYKGFAKYFGTMIGGVTRIEGTFRLPAESPTFFEKLGYLMYKAADREVNESLKAKEDERGTGPDGR